MSYQRLIRLLVHPFFFGIIITAIVAFLAMPEISKYKVDVVEKRHIRGKHNEFFFADLNSNHSSEEIHVDHNPQMLKIMIKNEKGVLDQYNLKSKALHHEYLHFGDYNLDGYKEIYILTARRDSLLLSIIDPIQTRDFILKERLFYYDDTVSFGEFVPMGFFLGIENFPNGKKLIFATAAGFSKQPRSVFTYTFNKDEIKVSPLMGVSLHSPFSEDLDGDSVPEILFPTTAVGNYSSNDPYTDQSSWLMALNQDLEFVFNPVEIPKYPANLHVTTFRNQDSVFIVALNEYIGADTIPTGMYLYDHEGKQMQFNPLEQIRGNHYFLSSSSRKGNPVIYVLDGLHANLRAFDGKLEEINRRKIPPLYIRLGQKQTDIDQDGKMESIFWSDNPGKLIVFREHFKHPLLVDLGEAEHPRDFTLIKEKGIQYLFVRYESAGYKLKYHRHPFYYFKYPLIILVFLTFSGLIHLIFRLQKYRAERDYQAKRKMNELQIVSLKNQIEPHFTFNILNSIGSLYTRGTDPDLAYNVFVKYSNLLRTTIMNSDKVSIPMEEELEFVNTYVELEQFRSGQAFNYQVNISDDADLSIHIPRMLIHTFVENAIKHGVKMVKEGGLLEVQISRDRNAHHIQIRDNGPGPNSIPSNTIQSTGKGLKIIDEMLDLFYQLEGLRIKYKMEDISLKESNKRGTEISVFIQD